MEDLADPAEAISYLDVSVEEYQIDGDIPFLLKGIRNVVEAQGGVAAIAKRAAMSPETLSKILSSEKAPHLDTFAAVLNALGCRLSIEPFEAKDLGTEMEVVDTSVTPIEGTASNMELAADNE